MATHKGSEGTIKVGSNAVAELLSYSITENVDLIETTNITDAARLYTTGKTSWGGEIATNWDEGDTAQSALTIGASVTLSFTLKVLPPATPIIPAPRQGQSIERCQEN